MTLEDLADSVCNRSFNASLASDAKLYREAAIVLASVSLVTTPTKASAFDIGGMIGTAMSIQMQMNAHHGGSAGRYHARSRVSSHQDSESDHGSKSGDGERDASEPNDTDNQSRPSNKLAMGRETQSPASTSGGLSQASERDAAAGQTQGSSRTFNDAPAFSPSR
jgi:hypothetical protein